MHGKAEIRLGLDRHGGDAEKPTAPGRAVVMMGFGRLLGHASTVVVAHRSVGVEMSRDVHLGCVVPMNMGWPVDRQAVREPAAARLAPLVNRESIIQKLTANGSQMPAALWNYTSGVTDGAKHPLARFPAFHRFLNRTRKPRRPRPWSRATRGRLTLAS